ncbi:hypothetical protein GCM10007939_17200 [Amylibacter marinus]|uniref:Uncharacterized protein n=1 Tax=Amylibacter marinus TaxID=1475483 RepID=A0ABQ5VVX0_9RHOB|nr:hypothetical protein [Amylibacter marinus]GLQ35437.1 hypothetical protein GCM10007939_17200 [Amylibacter marinus]
MLLRLLGATIRAGLVFLTILMPTAMLTSGFGDISLFSIVLAVFASSVIFAEYLVEVPAVLEFRYASPYNRLRFLVVITLTLVVARGVRDGLVLQEVSGVLGWLEAMSGRMFSGWLSPVDLLDQAMNYGTGAVGHNMHNIASFALLVSIFSCCFIGVWLWTGPWPLSQDGFNLWPNMPSFSVRAGQRAAVSMSRIAILSFTLAISLPFILPFFIGFGRVYLGLDYSNSPLTSFWIVFFWAVIPAMALVRTIALLKLAFLAENLRKF